MRRDVKMGEVIKRGNVKCLKREKYIVKKKKINKYEKC